VKNPDLVQDQQLIWAFQPIQWWYLYRMPAWAKIVEKRCRLVSPICCAAG
jgi:hypothetical protein